MYVAYFLFMWAFEHRELNEGWGDSCKVMHGDSFKRQFEFTEKKNPSLSLMN